jgi:hypothetical protein
LPLVVAPLEVDAAEVDAPVDAPDALVAELDDEHAAVTPTSNAAAAPAAGTDTDRFISAPSREFRVRLPVPPIPPAGTFSFRQPRGNI